MVGFFNSEVDFDCTSKHVTTNNYNQPSTLSKDLKKKKLKATLKLIKRLIKPNNFILAIFLIVAAFLVNSPDHKWEGGMGLEDGRFVVNPNVAKHANYVSTIRNYKVPNYISFSPQNIM